MFVSAYNTEPSVCMGPPLMGDTPVRRCHAYLFSWSEACRGAQQISLIISGKNKNLIKHLIFLVLLTNVSEL